MWQLLAVWAALGAGEGHGVSPCACQRAALLAPTDDVRARTRQARSPGKRKRNPKGFEPSAPSPTSPKVKHTPEQQQQERQERLSMLSDHLNDEEMPSQPAASERKRGNTPPPIKLEFDNFVEPVDGMSSAWLGGLGRDELTGSTLGGLQQWPVDHGVEGLEEGVLTLEEGVRVLSASPRDAPSPLGNADASLDPSVEEAMASDWMGTYGEPTMGGEGTSPLLTPTGLQEELDDVF